MAHQAWKDKLAAGFVNSASFNGDKQTAIIQLATFAAQHGMLWVSRIITLKQLKNQNATISIEGHH